MTRMVLVLALFMVSTSSFSQRSDSPQVEHLTGAGVLPAGQGIGAMRFDNDPAALAGDLRLDNFLAMRAAFGAGIPTYLDDLSKETEAVVALLADGEATQ